MLRRWQAAPERHEKGAALARNQCPGMTKDGLDEACTAPSEAYTPHRASRSTVVLVLRFSTRAAAAARRVLVEAPEAGDAVVDVICKAVDVIEALNLIDDGRPRQPCSKPRIAAPSASSCNCASRLLGCA